MPSAKYNFDLQIQASVIQTFPLPPPGIHPLCCHCKTYASVGVPCWLVLVFGVFGFMPSSYIVLQTKMTTGEDAAGTGPRAPRPRTTHTQGTWYRSYGKIQNRRYANDSSAAYSDFLYLCGKLHSKTTIWWKVLQKHAEIGVTGKSKDAPRHLRRVIWPALLCEWMEGPQSFYSWHWN